MIIVIIFTIIIISTPVRIISIILSPVILPVKHVIPSYVNSNLFTCMCARAASWPVSCASHVPWSSPSRRSTTARTCCRASRSVTASTTRAPRCRWRCVWPSSSPTARTRSSAPATTTTAPSPEWWWPSLGSRAPRHPSACRASSGPLTSL